MEYRITVSFIFRTCNACVEDNSSSKSQTCCYIQLRWYNNKTLVLYNTINIFWRKYIHMLWVLAFVWSPTNLQKDLLNIQLSLSLLSQCKSVAGNYGKLNLVCTVHSVSGVNTDKFKATTFTLHGRRREQYLSMVSHVPTTFTKQQVNAITLSLS